MDVYTQLADSELTLLDACLCHTIGACFRGLLAFPRLFYILDLAPSNIMFLS